MAVKAFNLQQHKIMARIARELYYLYHETNNLSLAKQWYRVWNSHTEAIRVMEIKNSGEG